MTNYESGKCPGLFSPVRLQSFIFQLSSLSFKLFPSTFYLKPSSTPQLIFPHCPVVLFKGL